MFCRTPDGRQESQNSSVPTASSERLEPTRFAYFTNYTAILVLTVGNSPISLPVKWRLVTEGRSWGVCLLKLLGCCCLQGLWHARQGGSANRFLLCACDLFQYLESFTHREESDERVKPLNWEMERPEHETTKRWSCGDLSSSRG
jgi:hypothetical protein